MQSPFPFEAMLVFGWMAIMLLAGVLLTAKITFFQHYLIPSCLNGGMLGLILVHIGAMRLPVDKLETFAYHFFNISFLKTRKGNRPVNCGFTPAIWILLPFTARW